MNYPDEYGLPRGMAFVRAAIAKAVAPDAAADYARHRWGDRSAAVALTRGAIGASDQDRGLIRAGEAETEFLDAVRMETALDRLPGLRRVPANVPVAAQTGRAIAHWRGQAKAAKVSRQAFDRQTLRALEIATLVVFSNDLLRDTSLEGEQLILRDLVAAIAYAADASFFNVANTGSSNVEPASITSAGAAVASVGDLVADLQAARAEFRGQWSTSAFVCAPALAIDIGLVYGSKGIAVDCGARGGTLAGLPLLTTEGLETNSYGTGDLILVDAGSVVLVDEGAEVLRSAVTTVEMDDAPGQDGLAPAGPSGAVVSMFQTDNTALMATRRLNWRLARAGGCVTIAGCTYGQS